MLWLNFKSRWNTPVMAPIWIFSSVVLQKSSSLEENGNNVQYKSYYIVFSFELYFAFFPLSFFLLTRSVFMSSKFTCQFCSNYRRCKTSLAEKKSFHKGMSESFQYSVEQTTRGNLWCFQNSNVWQRKLGKFFVVLISFNTFSCVAPIIIRYHFSKSALQYPTYISICYIRC